MAGYFKFRPSIAAPTVPEYSRTGPKFGPGFIPETTISGVKGHNSLFPKSKFSDSRLARSNSNKLFPLREVFMQSTGVPSRQ